MNYYLKNILTDHQHGFVSGKSTVTNLMEFTSSIFGKFATHKQINALYLDLAKAFDSVSVDLLFKKMHWMGVDQQLLHWLFEYFKERQQIVRINSSTISNPIDVTSGVGQGYPMSASLFNIFIFDLPLFLQYTSISLYADDAKIYLPMKTSDDCQILQNELIIVNEYFSINCLKLNEKNPSS